MLNNFYIKSHDGHDFIYSQELGECSIILNSKNHAIRDVCQGEMIDSKVYSLDSKDGHYCFVNIATEAEYKQYVKENYLMEKEDSRKRSKHGFETFEIARKLFPKQKESTPASTGLIKLLKKERECKVAGLLENFPSEKKRALENRLNRLSNDCAGVSNTKELTNEQAHCIIHYTRGVDPELILGHR